MLAIDHDRRSKPRVSLTRPCKLFEPRARKYLRGTTCNVSSTGMLIRLDRPLELDPGGRLYVAVARKRSSLIRSAEMVEARIVRTRPDAAGDPTVAIQFHDPCSELHLPVHLAA